MGWGAIGFLRGGGGGWLTSNDYELAGRGVRWSVGCKCRKFWRTKGLDTYMNSSKVLYSWDTLFTGMFCGAKDWGSLSFYGSCSRPKGEIYTRRMVAHVHRDQ